MLNTCQARRGGAAGGASRQCAGCGEISARFGYSAVHWLHRTPTALAGALPRSATARSMVFPSSVVWCRMAEVTASPADCEKRTRVGADQIGGLHLLRVDEPDHRQEDRLASRSLDHHAPAHAKEPVRPAS
jgi:hypothetical protein